MRWPVLLGALAIIAGVLMPAPADAGLRDRAKPAAAKSGLPLRPSGAYRHLVRFGRVFEALAKGSAEDTIAALDLFAEVFNRIQSRY
ncbi:MAG: hypothetical protein VCB77_02780, partial [Alphaproteobacteria bacterium]